MLNCVLTARLLGARSASCQLIIAGKYANAFKHSPGSCVSMSFASVTGFRHGKFTDLMAENGIKHTSA